MIYRILFGINLAIGVVGICAGLFSLFQGITFGALGLAFGILWVILACTFYLPKAIEEFLGERNRRI